MKKILFSVTVAIMSVLISVTPVFAGSPCTCTRVDQDGNQVTEQGETIDAAILSNVCDCGHGESVIHILDLIVDIMSIGIGILGVIGITIVGIQYLTAGGNEEKARKAKRRMFEIVIGLVAYVLIYAFLKWLMPGMA